MTSAGTFFFAIDRGLFEELGGFDESIPRATIEDYDLAYRLTNTGHRILLDRQIAVLHDRHYSWGQLLYYDFSLTGAKVKFFLRNLCSEGSAKSEKGWKFLKSFHRVDVSLGNPAQMWQIIANIPLSFLLFLHILLIPYYPHFPCLFATLPLTVALFLLLQQDFWDFVISKMKPEQSLQKVSIRLNLILITFLDGLYIAAGIIWGLLDFIILRKKY